MEYEKLLRAKLRDSSSSQAELEEAGVRMIVLYVLQRRVGILPESLSAKIAALSLAQTQALAMALSKFQSIADLEAWLKSEFMEQSPRNDGIKNDNVAGDSMCLDEIDCISLYDKP